MNVPHPRRGNRANTSVPGLARTGAVLGALALLGLSSGCASSNPTTDNHWNVQWVPRSIVYHTTGYIPERDGSWREFQWNEKRAINLTLRRHFLNSDPYN